MPMPPEQAYLRRILTAPVYDVAQRTPLHPAERLSQRLGCALWLKREDQQPIFSFKLRGAYNRMCQLTAAERQRGVLAVSAGNHAQGVALAATRLGVSACIVMPRTTPAIKIEAVRQRNAEIRLVGDRYDEASAYAEALAHDSGRTLIHPFDDPWVIAGQGTIGLEILQDCRPAPAAIYVPVGGGGLIAGIAAYCKAVNPQVQIIGVEPDDAASLQAALRAGRRVQLEQPGLFADGVAVKQVGKHPFALARRLVDGVITVSTDEICAAMQDIFEETRTLVEPAGALAVAGVKRDVADGRWHAESRPLIAVNSGANTNFDRLGHVVERAQHASRNEALLAVAIAERPGAFLRFCEDLGQSAITEFNYRYASPAQAQIFVGLRDTDGRSRIIQRLIGQGYAVADLSHNELAKVHLRHLVGGTLPSDQRERAYRFEFPERPGALLQFLRVLACRWNISLFHYRNHGAAYGRVLVGFMVPPGEDQAFTEFLDQLGLPAHEETANPAYQRFLARPPAWPLSAALPS